MCAGKISMMLHIKWKEPEPCAQYANICIFFFLSGVGYTLDSLRPLLDM